MFESILRKATGFLDSISQSRNKLLRAVYEFWVHSGVVNVMQDDPDQYIYQGYSGNADVYSIISRIDAMRKQAKLVLMRKLPYGESEIVHDHPLLKFQKRVNTSMRTSEFISSALIYRLVCGEFFVYKPKLENGINKGKVTEIFMMPANEIEIIEGTMFNPIRGYRVEGNQTEFSLDEVYHNKMFNPAWGRERSLHGQSPLKAAARIVSKQNQAEITELKQFENQGPPFIMYRDSTNNVMDRLTDPQKSELTSKVKEASRPENRGLPLILKEKFGILDIGRSAADLNIIESSRDGRVILCNLYGIPPVLFGLEGSTYNNMNTARKAAWTDCIIPNLKEIAEAFNSCTIEGIEEYEKEGLYWEFDTTQVEELQEGMIDKIAWMRNARWTPNEIRVATGREPIDNPKMDEPVFNSSEVFLSEISEDWLNEEKRFDDYIQKD